MMTVYINTRKSIIALLLLVISVFGVTVKNIQIPAGIEEKTTIYENCDSSNLEACTTDKIRAYFIRKTMIKAGTRTFYREYSDEFEYFSAYLNCFVCRAEEDKLKEMLVVEFIKAAKDTSKVHKYVSDAIWSILIWGGWCPEFEEIVVKKLEDAKAQKEWGYYYGLAAPFVKYSPNWFRYAMEVYHTEDTTKLYDKNYVYRTIIDRFQNNVNPVEMKKVESLLYAVLKKKEYYDFYAIDAYLSKISNLYKNSKQRTAICTDVEKTYIEYRKKEGWSEMFDHIDSTKTYLSKQKTLTDYTPPLTIE